MQHLELADWRRRIAELYADVRRISKSDPQAAWERWRDVRDRMFRDHPQSPIPEKDRSAFRPRYFDYDPSFRLQVHLRTDVKDSDAGTNIPMSSGQQITFGRIGLVEVSTPYGSGELSVYWIEEYAGGIFLVFRDSTCGGETYGGGRYLLDTAKAADLKGDPDVGTIVLDFNFAYHPSCVFDARWSCPLASPENTLPFAIAAGERLPSL